MTRSDLARKTLSILILVVLTLGCAPEEPLVRVSGLGTPVCTGFNLTTVNGEPNGQIGIPNTKLALGDIHYYTYPNPSANYLAINGSVTGQHYVWIVKAKTTLTDPYYSSFGGISALQAGGTPLASNDYFNPGGNFTINLDVSSLPIGIYRVYIHSNGKLFWDNILIQH